MDYPQASSPGAKPASSLNPFIRRLPALLACAALLLLTLARANAAPIPFSGTFSTDDQVNLFNFSLNTAQSVTIQTNSYAAGGFVPIISLFGSTGILIADDGGDATCQSGMSANAATHLCNDATVSQTLAAGTYTIGITEFFNFPNGPNLANGFFAQGLGNFTGASCTGSGSFLETDLAPCAQRTNAFAGTITPAGPTTPTPEPSSILLVLPPAAYLLSLRRRRRA